MAFPNVSHIHNWELVFSNIPNIESEPELKYFHNYIKDFTVPGVSLQTVNSSFAGSVIHHPITPNNTDLQTFNVTFVASEGYENYLRLFEWMMDLRYANYDLSSGELLRKQDIKTVSVRFFDNEKRDIARLDYGHVIPTDIGALNLQYQSSDETSFTMTFMYQDVNFTRLTV